MTPITPQILPPIEAILQQIAECAFSSSGLQSINIRPSAENLCKSCFSSRKSLTFETGSKLQRIEESALSPSSLQNIIIPASFKIL
jgi:hypothetical protein